MPMPSDCITAIVWVVLRVTVMGARTVTVATLLVKLPKPLLTT